MPETKVSDCACLPPGQEIKNLVGLECPGIRLRFWNGDVVDLSRRSGTTVVFTQPGSTASIEVTSCRMGEASSVSGMTGCLAQRRAFGSKLIEFTRLGAQVLGVSGQPFEALRSLKRAEGLLYDLASDADASFLKALGLKQIVYEALDGSSSTGSHPRVVLVVRNGKIVHAEMPEASREGVELSAQVAFAWLQRDVLSGCSFGVR